MVSHLGNIITDYFGDASGNSPATGKPFGVCIECYFEKEPFGNTGALLRVKDKLTSDFSLIRDGGRSPELKSDCRKTKPGMLFKATEDFNIDLP